MFKRVAAHFLAHAETARCPTVEVITYNNGKAKLPLEIQAARLGLTLHVVARDFHPWSWVAKITEPKKCLEHLYSPEQMVLLADGNDTIFTRAPGVEEIKGILRFYGSPSVLFCPTSADWPPNEACRQFERRLSTSSTPHLSAGAYVGTVQGILAGMEWIEKRRSRGWLKYRGKFDDQLSWRRAHRLLHPKLQIDTEGLLFARFDHRFLRSLEAGGSSWEKALGLK